MRRLLVTAGALAVAVVATVAVTAAPAQANGARDVVLNQGHADVIGVAFEDGVLELAIHDEEAEVEREPEDVTIQVLPEAETTIPADPAFGFLGAAGDPVWTLPQVENPALLFAGLGTEEVEPGALVNDEIRVTVAVFGPGEVALYIEDELGLPSEILFDTDDSAPNRFTLGAGNHLHANWAFSEPGDYYWAVVTTAGDAGTNDLVADAGLFHFEVLS